MKNNMKRVLALLLALTVCIAFASVVYAVDYNQGDNEIIDDWDHDGPAAPDAPTLEGKTGTSVTLAATDGYEYRMNDGAWQSSNVFENLEPETAYIFYQRVAADVSDPDDTYAPSASSEGLAVTTDANTVVYGDADEDGEPTGQDIIVMYKYLGHYSGVTLNVANADVDCDGEVTGQDIIIMYKYLGHYSGFETLPVPANAE